jgi:formylglycine-generating enzyme required for sulfatase activity
MVNWFEAVAFCRWLSQKLGYPVRLPDEVEWEKAARGPEGLYYPWANEYTTGNANIDETWSSFRVGPYNIGQTTAVGIYPQGASRYPEPVLDMAGNVWEWTRSAWDSDEDERSVQAARVVRGGSWFSGLQLARAASRGSNAPLSRVDSIGFRVVSPAPIRPLNSDALDSVL